IAVSFAVVVLALSAVAFVRWRHRRFAALLIATGVLLGVGVHPFGDRSPLMRLLTGNGDDGLALALRSSTRALPLVALGVGLVLAAGVDALDGLRRVRFGALGPVSPGVIAAVGVAVLVVANVPAVWSGGLVDPAIDREQDVPAAWRTAAATLDDPDRRV